jgi:pyruvate dehydrogenase E1 component alpha subunit
MNNDFELKDQLLESCLRIRMIEQRIADLYHTDLFQSPVHLSIGQEAVAVGVCASLNGEGLLFINYRGHAYYLARGGDLNRFFAELAGRQTGISKGKAGSMHLACPELGVIGASAVVGSSISNADSEPATSSRRCLYRSRVASAWFARDKIDAESSST